MIRKKLKRHFKWVNIEKDIANEKNSHEVRVFGILVWKREFEASHDMPDDSKKLGFKSNGKD